MERSTVKYEYRYYVTDADRQRAADTLNGYGADGWKIVSTVRELSGLLCFWLMREAPPTWTRAPLRPVRPIEIGP